MSPLQVLIEDSGTGRLVAGLPPSLRAARRAAEDLKPGRIVFCGNSPEFPARWRRWLDSLSAVPAPCADGEAAGKFIDPEEPLLVLAPGGFPRGGGLRRFLAEAREAEEPARWIQDGAVVAAYFRRAGEAFGAAGTAPALAHGALRRSGNFRSLEARSDWLASDRPDSIRDAERALCAELPRDKDGYLARFDRRLSIALSLALSRTPLTPNHITTASLLLGLLGAGFLASGSRLWQFSGSVLLWFCCILDGCDGEVARLKLLSTPAGAVYDLWADQLAHLATFVAIPFGVHRMFPERDFLLPGVLLVSGFIACGFSVWWLVLRPAAERRGPHWLVIERLASRDYVYLLAVSAALGRLDWFLWAAGVGSHVFYLGLWWLSLRPGTGRTSFPSPSV